MLAIEHRGSRSADCPICTTILTLAGIDTLVPSICFLEKTRTLCEKGKDNA